MARGDVYPPRTSLPGDSVEWGRQVELRNLEVERDLTSLEQSSQAQNRTTAAQLGDLSRNVFRLNLLPIPIWDAIHNRDWSPNLPGTGWNQVLVTAVGFTYSYDSARAVELQINAQVAMRDLSPGGDQTFRMIASLLYLPRDAEERVQLDLPASSGAVAMSGPGENSRMRVATINASRSFVIGPTVPGAAASNTVAVALFVSPTSTTAFNNPADRTLNYNSLSVTGSYRVIN